MQQRFKKRGYKGSKPRPLPQADDDESGSDSDADAKADSLDDEVVGTGFKDVVVNVNSLRVDTVLKSATKWSRTKIEEIFYDSRVRVNGVRLAKKSEEVVEGDEIDLIHGRNEQNPDFLDVLRLEIKEVPDKANKKLRLDLKIRKYLNLTVENYASDPYDGTLINSKIKKQLSGEDAKAKE